jgi:cytochrome c-type biogenesis protein CcmH/NrfG
VPGWPIGFGDKARAEELLPQGAGDQPDGIDPNFFYGEYLADRGRYGEAMSYLEKALKAPARPGARTCGQRSSPGNPGAARETQKGKEVSAHPAG